MSSRRLDPGEVPLRRKAGGNVWAKLAQVAQWLVLAAVFVALLACFLPVIRQVQNLQNAKAKLAAQVAAEQASNRTWNRQLDLLKTNPEYIERVARDKLNVGKTGEIIFRFDPYPPKPSAAVPPAASSIPSAPAP
jgi:cell division protein DivIC